MNSSFSRFTILATLISLSLSILGSHDPIDYHKKGREQGKTLLTLLAQKACTDAQHIFMDKDILELSTILNKNHHSTEVHKKAFKSYQEYFKGLRETLSTHTPLSDEMAQKVATMILEMSDAVIQATDIATLRTSIATTMSRWTQKLAAITPKIPQVQFVLDPSNRFYQAGYALGKQSIEWMIIEAQGKTVSVEEQVAAQQKNASFLGGITPGTQEAVLAALQYIHGMKKALEACDLDSIITQYNTPKIQAEKLKIGYKLGLQSANSMIEALQNPQKGFGQFAENFKEAMTNLNTLDQ